MPQQKYLCIQRSQPREGARPSPVASWHRRPWKMSALRSTARRCSWRGRFVTTVANAVCLLRRRDPRGITAGSRAEDPLRLRCPGDRASAVYQRSERVQTPRSSPRPFAGASASPRGADRRAMFCPTSGRQQDPVPPLHRGVPVIPRRAVNRPGYGHEAIYHTPRLSRLTPAIPTAAAHSTYDGASHGWDRYRACGTTRSDTPSPRHRQLSERVLPSARPRSTARRFRQ